jgi:hypothetical protein
MTDEELARSLEINVALCEFMKKDGVMVSDMRLAAQRLREGKMLSQGELACPCRVCVALRERATISDCNHGPGIGAATHGCETP